MFGPLGVPELLFIFVLALLIFGPRKLPEIGRSLGRAMGELRRATSDLKGSLDTELALEDEASARRTRTERATAAPAASAVPDLPSSDPGRASDSDSATSS